MQNVWSIDTNEFNISIYFKYKMKFLLFEIWEKIRWTLFEILFLKIYRQKVFCDEKQVQVKEKKTFSKLWIKFEAGFIFQIKAFWREKKVAFKVIIIFINMNLICFLANLVMFSLQQEIDFKMLQNVFLIEIYVYNMLKKNYVEHIHFWGLGLIQNYIRVGQFYCLFYKGAIKIINTWHSNGGKRYSSKCYRNLLCCLNF